MSFYVWSDWFSVVVDAPHFARCRTCGGIVADHAGADDDHVRWHRGRAALSQPHPEEMP